MFPLTILRPLRTRDYTNKCFPLMREKCSETRIGDSQVINTVPPTAICICQPSVTVHLSNIFTTVSLPFKHMPSRLLRHAHGVEDNTKDYNIYISRTLLLLPSFSIDTTAHCGLWPVEQCPSIFSCLPPTLSIFSIPALEDLFLLPLSILSWVFPFFSSLPVLEWRSFWASYPPPFSLGKLTSLSFTLLSTLLYFLLYSYFLITILFHYLFHSSRF